MNKTMPLEKPASSFGIAVFLLILAISVIENKLGRSQICLLADFSSRCHHFIFAYTPNMILCRFEVVVK